MKLVYENIRVRLGGREILKGLTLSAEKGRSQESQVPTDAENPRWSVPYWEFSRWNPEGFFWKAGMF